MKRAKKADFSLIFILFSLVLGLLLGWVSHDLMGMSTLAATIISNLGIWIFISSIIADFSPDAPKAAIHNFVFLIGVIAAYYAHVFMLGGGLAVKSIIIWLVFAAFGALLGFIVHNSRVSEWIGAICASVPISLLIAEGWEFYKNFSIPLILDIVFAVILYFLLSPGKYQKLMALPFIIIFVFALVYFNVLSGLLGSWI